jgi:hypothetical protein
MHNLVKYLIQNRLHLIFLDLYDFLAFICMSFHEDCNFHCTCSLPSYFASLLFINPVKILRSIEDHDIFCWQRLQQEQPILFGFVKKSIKYLK